MRTFFPALLPALRQYRRADLFADLGAGLTVGIIALPLAIGFAIAAGGTPQQGLWTGTIAGIVVGLFGGSRFQIAGPTGLGMHKFCADTDHALQLVRELAGKN